MKKTNSPIGERLTTTVSLAEEVHKRLKHLAVDRKTSVRDLIREAIEEYLNRREKKIVE
jgi:predicted transcriptional regulator